MDPSAFPATLILEPGITVEGRFQRLERGHTKDGEARGIAILDIDGTENSVWLLEVALRDKMRELKPEVGELVRISKGSDKRLSEASGRRYWPFKVTAPERPTENVGWDDAMFNDGDTTDVGGESDLPSTIETPAATADADDFAADQDEPLPF